MLVFKAKIGSVNCFKEEESVIVYQVELWRLDHPSLEPRGVEAWQGVAQMVSRHKTLGFNFMKIIFINILAGRQRVSGRYTLVYLCADTRGIIRTTTYIAVIILSNRDKFQ